VPALPPSVPRRRSAFLRGIGRVGLAALDWRIDGNLPDVPKLVIIVAPHTSNWDFFVGLFAALAIAVDAKWFGKHTAFRGPVGGILRALGGIPVVRSSSQNVVEQWVAEFEHRDRIVLALAPEGTRKKVAEWRSGFWHLARGAGAPLVPVALDYGRRAVAIGATYWPTDDLESDLRNLKAFFGRAKAKNPSLY